MKNMKDISPNIKPIRDLDMLEILKTTLQYGGCTWSLVRGALLPVGGKNWITDNYAVARRSGVKHVFAGPIDMKLRWLAQSVDELVLHIHQDVKHIGTWLDDENGATTLYVDAVELFESLQAAMAFAYGNDQKAIFNLRNGETLNVAGYFAATSDNRETK